MDITFFRGIGVLELSFLVIFAGFYLTFIYKTISIGKKVKSSTDQLAFKVIIRTLYFSLMLIALLGPTFGESRREVKSVGKDIYLLMDLSQSMDATDVQPSRMEKAKFELKNIIKAFNADRLGLIIFSNESFLQCPLTYDNSAMLLFVETLHTGLISNSGTDFAPALKMALDKHQVVDNQTVNNQQSKIIILISDGEDFGDETTQIAKEIKDQEIKLYTVGIGTKKGSKIPQGYKFKRDNKGDDVITTLNSKPLEELAELTGGKYFEINDKDNQISQLIDSIDLLEGELRSSKEIDAAANRYFYFLLAAFILMVLDMVIKVKVVKF